MNVSDMLNFLMSLGKTKLLILCLVVFSVIGSTIGLFVDLSGKTKYIFLLVISLFAGYMFLILL